MLDRLDPPPSLSESLDDLGETLTAALDQRHAAGALDDYPLPELYRRLRETFPRLSLGQFHDALRCQYQRQALYLHPWTGPLHELPEPALALLVGHEIVYYASRRA